VAKLQLSSRKIMATAQIYRDISAESATGTHELSSPAVELAVPHWYAIYTCARHEKCVAKQLAERGIESFLPLYRSWHTWKDRRKEVELALFPSYVFVHIAAQMKLRVLQLPGVVHLVSSSGQPTPLPNQEIEALRDGLDQQIYAEPHPYLKVGRKVQVKRGPLAGTEGILIRKKDKFRVVISLDVLMRSVAVEVDAADVVALQ
jgi:transcription termination/antitermination protein NusG